jgi:hypothetical protein
MQISKEHRSARGNQVENPWFKESEQCGCQNAKGVAATSGQTSDYVWS